jgi:ADP-ribose pyrophosphatase
MAESASNVFPRIAASRTTQLSAWVTIVENRVVTSPQDAGAIYHSIATADYVSVLALTPDGRVPVVKQFRPAVDRLTTEFPGGMRDEGEPPEACAIRELAEEAGLRVDTLQPLAVFFPDSGRLGNRMWTYFAREAVPIAGWAPEPGIEFLMLSLDELFAQACDGSFDHGPHLAMLGMATIKGLLPQPSGTPAR